MDTKMSVASLWEKQKRIRGYHKKWRDKQREKLFIIAGRQKPQMCELCGNIGRIVWDHNHITGRFRGWICSQCNTALGLTKENISLLMRMIDYINKHKS